MPELLDVTQLILKHLPPSADLPNVHACDERGRRWAMALQRQGHITLNDRQAIDGVLASDLSFAPEAAQRLRPQGRAIFLIPNGAEVASQAVVQALTSAGLVRVLTEAVLDGAYLLARGERPAGQPRPVERSERSVAIADITPGALNPIEAQQAAERYRALHLLVQQDPPGRGWAESAAVTWRASTVRDVAADRVVLLAFTSLVKAVAFMQPAVLAGAIHHINKMPRYEVVHLIKWGLPVIVNPVFEVLRADTRFAWDAPGLEVEPRAALKSHE